MVNSIGITGGGPADLGPKVGSSTPKGAAGKTTVDTSAAQAQPVVVKTVATAAPLVETAPLAPPLTSLALWRDSASGMQVAVVRDRVSGEVVEKFPTDRALRLAAMVRQQALAQELQAQQEQTGNPRIDLQT